MKYLQHGSQRRPRVAGKSSSSYLALLSGNIGLGRQRQSAENRRHIVTAGEHSEMLVQFQSGPLDKVVYFVDGRPVEILYVPRLSRPKYYFVRDKETLMCFVVEAHKLVNKPEGK